MHRLLLNWSILPVQAVPPNDREEKQSHLGFWNDLSKWDPRFGLQITFKMKNPYYI